MIRRLTKPYTNGASSNNNNNGKNQKKETKEENKNNKALKHLFCGGVAGSVAKTVTAPLSRLTILYQVHSLVTTKENRPRFAMTYNEGIKKIIERGGIMSLWKGNVTSVIHRFPFSAINFYVHENMLRFFKERRKNQNLIKNNQNNSFFDENEDDYDYNNEEDPSTIARMISGGVAGCSACVACYPLDLVRTRLTTELPGQEHYKGIIDAFTKIIQTEGVLGLYAGIGPTLFVAVPNFAISYTVYGTLKEYVLDDDLFYNLRKVDVESGQESLGFKLSLLCGAASGTLSTLVTFPFDTVRRRMQIQNLHVDEGKRMTGLQQITNVVKTEGFHGLYRGLPPEILKVIPMVGTMFTVYEFLKQKLDV